MYNQHIWVTSTIWLAHSVYGKIKAVFSEENYVPPTIFLCWLHYYGIKLWRPFKQQYSIDRNGHMPKWLWAEIVMDRNGHGPK